MIVRTHGSAILLITQSDHARLAGEIMARSLELRGHPRRESILLAVAEHDNGWREEDAAPIVDPATGGVVDFVTAPLAVRHRVWPRAVERLEEDPWAAALVAQHAITVYDRYRQDHAWDSFFAGMEAARERMRVRSGRPLEELQADYVHVRLGDLISLAFCTGWTDEHSFSGWRVRYDGERVYVAPDPFGGAAVPVHIEARELAAGSFADDETLRARLPDAPSVTLTASVSSRS